MPKYFITASSDTTLTHLLTEHLPPGSEPGLIIDSGGVWLGGGKRLLDPDTDLKKGTTVRVYTSELQGKHYHLKSERIVYENSDFLVVDKPGNLNVQAVPSSLHYNLSYSVGNYLNDCGLSHSPSPITRLDRVVSGLVIFGKSKQGEARLFALVKQRLIKKWYIGALEPGTGPKQLHIRDHISNPGPKTVADPLGKEAASYFRLRRESGQSQIYSIFIFTGRRHQIRFHAANYLTPIVGDHLYSAGKSQDKQQIALICAGYNIPWRGKTIRVRLADTRIQAFFSQLGLKY